MEVRGTACGRRGVHDADRGACCDGTRYQGGGSVNGMTPAGLALIGVPANSNGMVDGVARSPAVLRQRGLATALARHRGFTDDGDLALPAPVPVRGPSGLLAKDALVTMIGQVAEAVRAARRRGWFPLLLGGDCPVILGALAALQAERDRAGLLFVDGHEDTWPPRASPTGEAADCELGLALRLAGRSASTTPTWIPATTAPTPSSATSPKRSSPAISQHAEDERYPLRVDGADGQLCWLIRRGAG